MKVDNLLIHWLASTLLLHISGSDRSIFFKCSISGFSGVRLLCWLLPIRCYLSPVGTHVINCILAYAVIFVCGAWTSDAGQPLVSVDVANSDDTDGQWCVCTISTTLWHCLHVGFQLTVPLVDCCDGSSHTACRFGVKFYTVSQKNKTLYSCP